MELKRSIALITQFTQKVDRRFRQFTQKLDNLLKRSIARLDNPSRKPAPLALRNQQVSQITKPIVAKRGVSHRPHCPKT
ncbi:MAG: hypothetical protein JGK12_30095 [Microcoleus sp. PH2017_01_SCD_O_A]|uniref:hypothetical protein n=1 Tax=unclassified Microcoleus TaxID=2642155 RepID=UPI001E15EBE8|nr:MULTISPECIES: hypothetical protein [unclassified Microcoleus]MCC3420988.1 hypothetical protein [Microcoleus sp. PH2017_07_MST_O_A]MCC3430777.1 hypothetical protein [Microcoleus sp. PH2017_04_SCI_O_A]MCC3512898.1 hypothetical protein [Microcoleus sp. PH2017_17_BER_D_A]TAG64173.1 MAG: hypothetical protein EAZ25_21615 [Oscillatoriales cyanobacterium]MCC3428056.1 hypothetical protein [Microcoleus sp. PH2017_01_SCD_O_A]